MNNQQENNTESVDNDNLDSDQDNSGNTKDNSDTSAIYFGDSTLQTKAEFDQDKKPIIQKKTIHIHLPVLMILNLTAEVLPEQTEPEQRSEKHLVTLN